MTIPENIIRSAMSQTLEEMYFCAGTWTGSGTLRSSAIGASVAFTGSFRGEFKVVATARFATQLAADFLAADVSEITDSQALALMHEFANVACGATLSAWMPGGNFHFSVPSSLEPEQVRGQWPHRFCTTDIQPELAVALVVSGES